MKKYWTLGATALLALTLAACGTDEGKETDAVEKTSEAVSTDSEVATTEQVINYLGTEYTFPAPATNIVTASLEAMEDAVVLGIKPVGVLEVAGEIPSYLSEELAGATLIGDKMTPNTEAILTLDPDAIIGTSKWGEDMFATMNKMATTLPYSHISTNWKENLLAFGQLTDKEAEAKQIIEDYETKATEAKEKLGESIDKEVLIIRVRSGIMNVYPAGVYLNPVIYEDLGFQVPDAVVAAEAQAELTLESLADLDPDVIFLQFETSENANAPAALEELQANPIFKNLTASKNGEVHVNTVSPLAQGGTAWSKVNFLDAAVKKLVK